jgi:hypothetical protein
VARDLGLELVGEYAQVLPPQVAGLLLALEAQAPARCLDGRLKLGAVEQAHGFGPPSMPLAQTSSRPFLATREAVPSLPPPALTPSSVLLASFLAFCALSVQQLKRENTPRARNSLFLPAQGVTRFLAVTRAQNSGTIRATPPLGRGTV